MTLELYHSASTSVPNFVPGEWSDDERNNSSGELSPEAARLHDALQALTHEFEHPNELGLRAKQALIGDGDHIENQQIDIIDASDRGAMVVSLKLRHEQHQQVYERLAELKSQGGEVTSDRLVYQSALTFVGAASRSEIADTLKIEQNGVTVSVVEPQLDDRRVTIMAAQGLVQIELSHEALGSLDEEELTQTLRETFTDILGVPDALSIPTPEAELRYKEARYRWHHKIDDDEVLSPEQETEIDNLRRKEVFPGYYTMVSEGKHKEYEEKYGEFVSYHTLGRHASLVNVVKAGGILSSHERFKRGLLLHGMSMKDDFQSGGADSVFTRTFADKRSKNRTTVEISNLSSGAMTLVLQRSLFDRTDMYAYECDNFGTISPETFAEDRQSVDELFDLQLDDGFNEQNEQMFRTGIALSDIAAVTCTNEAKRTEVLESLRSAGITIVNDQPIEQFVHIAKTVEHALDISYGREPDLPKVKRETASIDGEDEEGELRE